MCAQNMIEQERYLRRKYGNQMLLNGIVSLTIGIAIFVIGLKYLIDDDFMLSGSVISTQALLTDAMLAFISVYASGAYRKDTRNKKISDRSRKAIRGVVIAGSVAQALSGDVNTAIIASDALQNNDLTEIHFRLNKILPIIECVISAFLMIFGLCILTGSETVTTLNIVVGAVVIVAQVIQIITAISSCRICSKWDETVEEINRKVK